MVQHEFAVYSCLEGLSANTAIFFIYVLNKVGFRRIKRSRMTVTRHFNLEMRSAEMCQTAYVCQASAAQ